MKTGAICVFVRNEERGIQEWIAYHSLIGFDAIIVYDNGSTDATVDAAKAMQRVADVTVVDWSHATGQMAQGDCYEDCCKRFAGQYEWIAFLDSDEFLAPPPQAHLSSVLAGKFFAAGIAFNWACFGSNGHQQAPEALTIASFTRRSEPGFFPNKHTKIIVRPDLVKRVINPHYFDIDGYYVRPDGMPIEWEQDGLTKEVILSDWKINHYFVRSQQHWANKVARGYRDGTVRTVDLFQIYDRNEVEDCSAAALTAGVGDLIQRAALKPRRNWWQRVTSLLTPGRLKATSA
jgi:glycosyltransferase involved in cell wall biosynthesis